MADYQERLLKADEIVFIFPIWWEAMPAMTKGTIIFKANDRVTPPVVVPVTPTDPTDPNKEGDKPTGNT